MRERYVAMKTKTANKGFTLIELLVVIAIISVLLSVITPALQNARRQARRTRCFANIRAQYVAQFYYATDNEGKFASHWDYSPNRVRNTGIANSKIREAMDDYVENSGILFCPALALDLGGPWYNDLGYKGCSFRH